MNEHESITNDDYAKSFEPKTANRFIVKFGEPFDIIPEYVTKSVSALTLNRIDESYVWEDVVFELYDPIHPSTSAKIRDAMDVLKKLQSNTILVNVTLLDPVGTVISEWKLTGFIKEIDFGKLTWENGNPIIISIKFKVYSAILNY
jgi:hypothetical protein